MIAVFFTFALSGPLPPKEMGVILGVAVLTGRRAQPPAAAAGAAPADGAPRLVPAPLGPTGPSRRRASDDCLRRLTRAMSYTATSPRPIDGTLRHEVDVNGRHTTATDEPAPPRRHRHRPDAARAARRDTRIMRVPRCSSSTPNPGTSISATCASTSTTTPTRPQDESRSRSTSPTISPTIRSSGSRSSTNLPRAPRARSRLHVQRTTRNDPGHGDSPARTGARTKAVVPSPGRTRSDLGAFERPICPAQRLGLVEAGVPVGRYPWEPRL